MKDLTIIIPVHKYDQVIEEYLGKAIESCKKSDTKNEVTKMFVGPKDVIGEIKNSMEVEDWVAVYNENTGFPAQVNAAVKECKTKYFSVLELDDTYYEKWFDTVERYINAEADELQDITIYLPLTEVVDFTEKEKGPIGYINEAVWASSFSNEIGFLDIECLKNYINFNTTGGVFKKDAFVKHGGLKESIKLAYWYEFLLRTLNNGGKVFVIPKVGYTHLINRPDSEADNYNKTMSQKEADWWVELAQKDYLFISERDKSHYIYE